MLCMCAGFSNCDKFNTMTQTRFKTLVATKWLRNQLFNLGSGAKHLRVLDASATPDPRVDGFTEFYLQSHIPNASYFNLHALCPSSPSSFHKYPVPDANRFQDYVESLGVSNETHVITYDRSNTIFALKTWWLFRLFGHTNVSVLDGGFRKWLIDGFEVCVDIPEVERASFTPAFNPKLLHNFEDMTEIIKEQNTQIVDARSPASFHNQIEGHTGGHLPGSKLLPYKSLFEDDGTFKDSSELKSAFDTVGVDLSLPLVATCETAMTACGVAAAAHILGKEIVPVYNGAFREWSQRAEADQIEEN